jgi:hypothetical protein
VGIVTRNASGGSLIPKQAKQACMGHPTLDSVRIN